MSAVRKFALGAGLAVLLAGCQIWAVEPQAPAASAPPPPPLVPATVGNAAPGVSVADTPPPAPAVQTQPEADPNAVVVPGVRERQITPPAGDPRSVSQRVADVRAWDQCVMRQQGAASDDPTRPQLDSPEDVCRRSLGMANREAVPNSRR